MMRLSGATVALLALALLAGLATACGPSARTSAHASGGTTSAAGELSDSALGHEIERIRAATAAYRDLAVAQAAGFPTTTPQCLSHPEMGVMGYHYVDSRLLDDSLEVEKPEILLYARDADGRDQLTAVEYIIPYSKWKRSEAPRFLGQTLRRSDPLQLWYLHVWVWEENPAGLFADYNPKAKC